MKALSPIAVLISALLLQGCVAAAVVGTAAVGTKAATDPRSVGTQVDDGTLEVRVNSALSKDEQIKKEARINVTAYQGKVLLVGQSPNTELSARAKQIAMGVDGANEVYNEIRQGQPIGLGEASNDTWITTKVRSQLLASDLVKSSNVKVTTENGEVFLMYLIGYGLGRIWIEGLRTDQLLLPVVGLPVSQLLSGCLVVGCTILVVWKRKKLSSGGETAHS